MDWPSFARHLNRLFTELPQTELESNAIDWNELNKNNYTKLGWIGWSPLKISTYVVELFAFHL